MDLGGGLGLDVGFQSSENAIDGDASSLKWTAARSVGFKHDGSGFWSDDWRSSKLAKTDSDYSPSSAAASDVHMLSFSSSSSKSDTSTSPYFQPLAGSHPKSAGYYSGALNSSTCMYLLNGVRGPFTASQWLELEQQALIYKYLTASEPIPAQLLIPIKKALESAGLFGFNGGPMRPTSWGWGPFHLGYSNSNDPEPGRCRRTDGKKWRCSRDAVPDQKYCERHINRGRHRSRKLVEGQVKGHSVTGAAKSTTTTKLMLPSAVGASSASVAPGVGLSNSFDMNQHYQQAKSLQHSASNLAMNPLIDRMLANRETGSQGLQDTTQLSFLSLSGSNVNLNYTDSAFSIPKHRNMSEESAPNSFAVPSSGSPQFTVTTSHKNFPICSENGASSHGLNGAGGSSILWPGLQLPSDATQLSASIPMGSSNFITTLSSQTSDKASFLPFRHPQQLEMGLGVGSQSHNNRQANWMSSSWEPSMGGPLGEALQSSGGGQEESKKTAALNLLPKGWDGMGSYQLSSSSPTGVLQKSALVSLSNSSAGSSPRTDNSKTIESNGCLCNDLLSSTTLAHSSSLPALE